MFGNGGRRSTERFRMCGRERSSPLKWPPWRAARRGACDIRVQHPAGARQEAVLPARGRPMPEKSPPRQRQNNRTEVEWLIARHTRAQHKTNGSAVLVATADATMALPLAMSDLRAHATLLTPELAPTFSCLLRTHSTSPDPRVFRAAASPPKEKQARSVAASFTRPQDRRRVCFSTDEPQVLRAPATRGRRRVRHSQRTSGQLSARTARPARLRPASRPHHDAERAQSASAARWGRTACQ